MFSISQRSSATQGCPCSCLLTSLRSYFASSSSCSTTTIGTSSPLVADSSPAPPLRKRYPAHKDPGAVPSRVRFFHTFAADSAWPIPPRCESPAIRNPEASPAQSKSIPRAAVPGVVHFSSAFLSWRSLKISLTWSSAFATITSLIETTRDSKGNLLWF